MPYDAGAAAIGNLYAPNFLSEPKKFPDIIAGLRRGHSVGEYSDLSRSQGDPIGKTLSAGVKQTGLIVSGN